MNSEKKVKACDKMVKIINFEAMDRLLTNKGCVIILSIACTTYVLLNLIILRLDIALAVLNALCTTVVFGIFLYFIREVSEWKQKEKRA